MTDRLSLLSVPMTTNWLQCFTTPNNKNGSHNDSMNSNTMMDMMLDDCESTLSMQTTMNNTTTTDDAVAERHIQEELSKLSIQEQEKAHASVLGTQPAVSAVSAGTPTNQNKIREEADGGAAAAKHNCKTSAMQYPEEDPVLLQEKVKELQQVLQLLDNNDDNTVAPLTTTTIATASQPSNNFNNSKNNTTTTTTTTTKKKTAYRFAREQNPTYVQDPTFLVAFLRSERYQVNKAALRFRRFLEEKLGLFGLQKLTSDILLHDLGTDGLRILQIGNLQVLPHRDQAHRRVIFGIPAIEQEGYTILGARKAHFYFWMSLVEENQGANQIPGIVAIMWRVHQPPMYADVCLAASKIRECCPIKVSAYHACHGTFLRSNGGIDIEYLQSYQAFFVNMAFPILKQFGRLRYYRAHYGTPMECQYSLLTQYGCPSDCFPLMREGDSTNIGNMHGNNAPTAATGDRQKQLGTTAAPLFHIRYAQDWMVERIQIDAEKKRTMIATMGIQPPSTTTTTTTTESRFLLTQPAASSYTSKYNSSHYDGANKNINNATMKRRRLSSITVSSMRMSMGIGTDIGWDQSMASIFHQVMMDEEEYGNNTNTNISDSLRDDLLQDSIGIIEGLEVNDAPRDPNNRLGSINSGDLKMFTSMMAWDEEEEEDGSSSNTESSDGYQAIDTMMGGMLNPLPINTTTTTATTPMMQGYTDGKSNATNSTNNTAIKFRGNGDRGLCIPLQDTTAQDVLLGRGRPLQKHAGNLKLRQLISDRMEEYERSNKHKKTEIAETIVQRIYQDGGRFLKQTDHNKTLWEEVDDEPARLKVSYTFRTMRKMNKKAAQQAAG